MEKENGLQTFIVGIVLIGITLVIAIFIAASMGDTFDNSTLASFSVANESGGYINSTGYTLAGYSADNFILGTTVVLNATDNSSVASNLYTITNGVITNATAVTYSEILVSYDYTTGNANSDEAAIAADNLVTSLSNGSAWITILVVVGFATIVLGMLTAGLNRNKFEEGGPIY